MNSLYLFQFACFIFMLVNAFIVALSHLHVRWENKRYERSRWIIVIALIGLAIQYVIQMTFGFRAMHDNLGAVINILIYTPCFSLISIGIYNIETTRANLRKMILMCSGIYAAIIYYENRKQQTSICSLPMYSGLVLVWDGYPLSYKIRESKLFSRFLCVFKIKS